MSAADEAPAMPQSVLAVRRLVVAYGDRLAVDGVSFDVQPSEIFGLLGPNGAGKTSTLSAVEGLLRPRSGSVTVGGVDVQRDSGRAKALIGAQLQASSFQPELTIEEIVRLYAGLYGVPLSRRDALGRIRDIGLGDQAGKRFKLLSGGQQQRLSLLIAVIHRPILLLLDEPTAGLDPQSRRQLWDRIEQLRADGSSIVLTTHSMEEAQAVCSRVAIVDRGRLLALDTPAGLIRQHRDDPRVRQAAHGEITLEDVFIGLTGGAIRD
ncbi:MAG: ABC transporter ATP-binding protein [Bifidobacterium tibiigranuli]|jgi:ABC-2 type transport system ATP-binding protein|nr:ABC transporter ATP-binding protein [Bifidobacterium tibiigranuli]